MANESTASQTDPSSHGSSPWENRGPLEIIDFILLTCESGALKTHIMCRCNLSSKQIKAYLNFLLNHRLVEKKQISHRGSRYIYATTPRGGRYVNAYSSMLKVLDIEPTKDNHFGA